VKEKINSVLAL